MKEYVIQPLQEGKGRSFRATCVALMTANSLFAEGAEGKTIRPAWAVFAGTEQELRPFSANLRIGRKLEVNEGGYSRKGDGDRLEFLKSIGYLQAWQREPEGALLTVYHPELFRLDPGLVDPNVVRCILLVPSDWSQAQKVDVTSAVRHVRPLAPKKVETCYISSLVPTAYLFAAYLDRRTRCPLVADGRFYLQLLVAALDKGIASLPGTDIKYGRNYHDRWGVHERHSFNVDLVTNNERQGLDMIGLEHAISVLVSHAEFETFLAEQVKLFFQLTHGEFRPVTEQLDLAPFLARAR